MHHTNAGLADRGRGPPQQAEQIGLVRPAPLGPSNPVQGQYELFPPLTSRHQVRPTIQPRRLGMQARPLARPCEVQFRPGRCTAAQLGVSDPWERWRRERSSNTPGRPTNTTVSHSARCSNVPASTRCPGLPDAECATDRHFGDACRRAETEREGHLDMRLGLHRRNGRRVGGNRFSRERARVRRPSVSARAVRRQQRDVTGQPGRPGSADGVTRRRRRASQ